MNHAEKKIYIYGASDDSYSKNGASGSDLWKDRIEPYAIDEGFIDYQCKGQCGMTVKSNRKYDMQERCIPHS